MAGIGVITNPKAKKNLKRPWIKDALQRIVGDAGWVYETRSIDELKPLAYEFIDKGIELLAVNGGDGTAHITLTHFIPIFQQENKPLPMLLNLRGGTMNTISKAIKHEGKGEDILTRVVEKYREGGEIPYIHQPILHINDRYGFMWGYGVVGNFLEQYYKGSSLGPWQAFKTTARIILSAIFHTSLAKQVFGPIPSVFDLDGKIYDAPECTGVLCSSIREVGLGAKLNYRAYEKPGHVHVRAASITPIQFLPHVPAAFLARRMKTDKVIDELARVARFRTEGKPSYTIDGELYKDTNEFVIHQGPVVRMIREGGKKLPKGIGLPDDWEEKALPEKTESKLVDSHTRRARDENYITI